MTQVKHTPGPWFVPDQTYARNLTVEVDDGIACPGSGGAMSYTTDVCVLGWNGTPEWDANARLIAAAPDMLEALQGLVSANNSTDGMAMRKAWDKADAAIARAKPAPTETRVECYRGEYYNAKEHGTCIKNPDGSIDWQSWRDAE